MKKVFVGILASLLLTTPAGAVVSLRGSPSSMARQNAEADAENLSRLTESQLEIFREKGLLVPLPVGERVIIDDRLPEKYRWCRPWTQDFLSDLGEEFKRKFGRPIKITSAVRTIEYQKELRRKNGNAESVQPGPRQSSHLTGSTVDIAKKGMSPAELQWMRNRLLTLEKNGLVEATEEFHQLVFHVMVFKKYEKPD